MNYYTSICFSFITSHFFLILIFYYLNGTVLIIQKLQVLFVFFCSAKRLGFVIDKSFDYKVKCCWFIILFLFFLKLNNMARIFGHTPRNSTNYRSSSSSGSAVSWASFRSFSICCCHCGSMVTSGGTNAGIATNSKLGSPISFRANHKNGFSKL